MCFLPKADCLMWINLEGFEQRVMLRLRLDATRRTYNDYFTIERAVSGAASTEVLYTLPFREIRSISYRRIEGTDKFRLDFDMGGAPMREITVVRHCFDYLTFRKMVKIHQKSLAKRSS